MTSPCPADLSGHLTIDPAGRLLALMPSTGQHHHVTGTRDDGPNTPFLLSCRREPTTPAQDRTSRSRRADGWLYALLALLVLAGFTRCTSARPLTAAHSTHGETAAPACLTTTIRK